MFRFFKNPYLVTGCFLIIVGIIGLLIKLGVIYLSFTLITLAFTLITLTSTLVVCGVLVIISKLKEKKDNIFVRAGKKISKMPANLFMFLITAGGAIQLIVCIICITELKPFNWLMGTFLIFGGCFGFILLVAGISMTESHGW